MADVRFILHDTDGNIRQWGGCPADLLDLQGTADALVVKRYDWGDDIANRKLDRLGRVVRKHRS